MEETADKDIQEALQKIKEFKLAGVEEEGQIEIDESVLMAELDAQILPLTKKVSSVART